MGGPSTVRDSTCGAGLAARPAKNHAAPAMAMSTTPATTQRRGLPLELADASEGTQVDSAAKEALSTAAAGCAMDTASAMATNPVSRMEVSMGLNSRLLPSFSLPFSFEGAAATAAGLDGREGLGGVALGGAGAGVSRLTLGKRADFEPALALGSKAGFESG